MRETKSGQVLGAVAINLRRQSHRVASEDNLFGFENPLFEQWRRNRTLVDVKERDVFVGNFVEQNDEFHQVGIGLLPEGLFAFAEQIVEQRGDAESQGISVQ